MKNLSILSVILALLLNFGFLDNLMAQQNITPQLLIQQNPVAIAPSVNSGLPAPQYGNPPLPPAQAGIPIVQTIPTKTVLENLQQAIETTRNIKNLLSAGKVWFMRSPTGEVEIKGGILFQGAVVAVLHFNPSDGSVLPLGVNSHSFQSNIGINAVKSNLNAVIGNLKVLPAAEFMEPETCWTFPLTINNIVVAQLKIYYDGIHVIEDYLTNQEMAFYGQ